MPDDIAVEDPDGNYWPDLDEPHQAWVDFAVKRGVARRIATATSKQQLIATLCRLDVTSE